MQNSYTPTRTVFATGLIMGDTKHVIPTYGSIPCRLTPYKTVRKMKIEVVQDGKYVYAGKLCIGKQTRKTYARTSFTNVISDEEFVYLVGNEPIQAQITRGFFNVFFDIDQNEGMRQRANDLELQKRLEWIEEYDCTDEEKAFLSAFTRNTLKECYKINRLYTRDIVNQSTFFKALMSRAQNKSRKYPKYINSTVQMFLSE